LVDEEDVPVQRVDLKSEPSQSLHELLSIEENQKHIHTSFDELTTDQIQDLSSEEIKEFSVYLKRKGLTIEEIAKHLHRGKTEIELLLKFHQ
jgi:site-specific recombinase XerC